MTWQTEYHSRLADWVELRQHCANLQLEQQLETINNWWFQAPIVNRVLTWNEQSFWPDPWQLLTNTGYCELARALGIVYTIMMIENLQYKQLDIVQVEFDNLVLIDQGKYILNWGPGSLLNIRSMPITVSRSINSDVLRPFLH